MERLMYNTDYLKQCEEFRRHAFGIRDSRNLPISCNYFPRYSLRVIKCVEDVNGEYVPKIKEESHSQ